MTAGLPARYEARGARYPQDVDAVSGLLAASDRVDVGFEDPWRSMVKDTWRLPQFDPGKDAVLVSAPDGSLVGSGECEWGHATAVKAFNRVHPDARGLGVGDWLVAWSEGRAAEHVAAGATPVLHNSVGDGDAAEELLRDRGYRQVRRYWHMERTLEDIDHTPGGPPGFDIRPVRVPEDLPEAHACLEEAFAGHFESTSTPFEVWRDDWLGTPGGFDPSLFLLAWEGDRVAGVAMSWPAGTVGWVGELGVRRDRRGHGVGEALLRASFAALAAAGLGEVRLNVDAENETGATRLYERAGMRVRRRWLVFEKVLGPA